MPDLPPAPARRRGLPWPVKAVLGLLVAAAVLGGVEGAMRAMWGPPAPDPGLVPLSLIHI